MRACLLVAVLATLACAAPAAAFTPPAIYVRLAHANSIDHTPVSDWMPIAAAPPLTWLGGYEIGYALQDAPGANHLQKAALRVTAVPDGQPTQPLNTPYCLGKTGDVGTIVPVGVEIQFEGAGAYTVSVSVGPAPGGQNDCMAGPETATAAGSFSVEAPIAPAVAGSPLVFRATRLADGQFAGVRAPAPPGGEADTRCARDATVNADGSVTGPLLDDRGGSDEPTSQVGERDFVRPGAWTCVARGFAVGVDDELNRVLLGGPWSAPLQLDVRSDFRRARGVISNPRAKRPTLRFTAEFPEVAGGGTGTLSLRRLTRCSGRRPVYRTVGTYKGVFDSKGGATIRIRKPRSAYYIGVLSFSGTRFYTKSVDPNRALLRVSDKGTLSYVSPSAFPQC